MLSNKTKKGKITGVVKQPQS